MKTSQIANYEEFKELFVREDGKRKNGILLSFLMEKKVRKFFEDNNLWCVFSSIRTMGALRQTCDMLISKTSVGKYPLPILGRYYLHPNFSKSDSDGFCLEGREEYHKYRYIKHEEGREPRPCRQKIGGLYKSIIDMSVFGSLLPENVKLWLCEELTHEWVAICESSMTRYEVIVDDDFEEIYDSHNMRGDFHSCMTNRGNHSFYRDAVKAKAARLIDHEDEDKMVARCVIFTEVQDVNTGEVLRLGERQYSSDCNDELKKILVHKLIDGDYIDGYKKIGAGCGESMAFVSKDGTDWSNRKFFIKCNLDYGDTLSYQDSFKYYKLDEGKCYNSTSLLSERYYYLDTTDGEFEYNRNYDEFHDEYVTCDVVNVWYNDRWYTCAEDNLDDFDEVDGAWVYYEDIYTCPYCGARFFRNGEYSDFTNEEYCCEDCLNGAEDEWKEENGWTYVEYDEVWVEDTSDVVTLKNCSLFGCAVYTETILLSSVERMMKRGSVIEIDEKTFITIGTLHHLMES